MEIDWVDEDPATGEKRFVRAERFARKWTFKVRFRRRTNWEAAPEPSRDMWETLLDALERRLPRREGVTDLDVKEVRAVIARLPVSGVEDRINHKDTKDTKEDNEPSEDRN